MKILLNTLNAKQKMITFLLITAIGIAITITGLIYGLKIIDPKFYVAIVGVILVAIGLFSYLGKLAQDIKSSKTQEEIKKNTTESLENVHMLIGKTENINKKIDTNKKDIINEVGKGIQTQKEYKEELKKTIVEQTETKLRIPELYINYSKGIVLSKSDEKITEFTFTLTSNAATASNINIAVCAVILVNKELKFVGKNYIRLISNETIPFVDDNGGSSYVEQDMSMEFSKDNIRRFTGIYFHFKGTYTNFSGMKTYNYDKLYFYNLKDNSYGGVDSELEKEVRIYISSHLSKNN